MHATRLRADRTRTAWTALLLMLAAPAALPTPYAGGSPPEEAPLLTDPSGDVSPIVATLPAGPNPAHVPAEHLDIVATSLEEFDGEVLHAKIVVQNLAAAALDPLMDRPVDLNGIAAFCFDWRGNRYGVRADYSYGEQPVVRNVIFGQVQAGCSGGEATDEVVFAVGRTSPHATANLDPEANAIHFFFHRAGTDGLSSLVVNGEALDPPQVGEALSAFYTRTLDRKGSSHVRFDVAPDAGPGGTDKILELVSANDRLKAAPDANAHQGKVLRCGDRTDLKLFAIPAGSKRGVPVVLRNLDLQPRAVTLAADHRFGEDWQPRVMPAVRVPAATEGGDGNVTVNVVIGAPPEATHKTCSVVRVRATDRNQPHVVGETTFGVVAITPPAADRNVLHLHNLRGATTCTADWVWVNFASADPDDQDGSIKIIPCPGNGGDPTSGATVGDSFLGAFVDVNPTHDLVLNTSASGGSARAAFSFTAEPLPIRGRFEVSIVSGRSAGFANSLGTAVVEKLIAVGPTMVEVDVPIDFTRELVAEGDPSRIVESLEGLGLTLRFQPVVEPPDSLTTRELLLDPAQSSIALPIHDVIERRSVLAGREGGLLALRPASPLPEFAAPGLPRTLTFELYNQGATTDMASVRANLSGAPGWTLLVHPPGPFELHPADQVTVAVAVTPPSEAKESEWVFVEFVAESLTDPSTRATYGHRIVASRGADVPLDAPPPTDLQPSSNGLPGPSAGSGFALVALAAALAARKQSHAS